MEPDATGRSRDTDDRVRWIPLDRPGFVRGFKVAEECLDADTACRALGVTVVLGVSVS